MTNAATTVCAATIGAFVGCLVSGYMTHLLLAATPILTNSPRRLAAEEIVLMDERNQPAARLVFRDGKTVVQFFNRDSTLARTTSRGAHHLRSA